MNSIHNNEYAGLPYDDINWYDIVGQPFGIASNFNAIIFGDANNIVDTKGAMAIGGNFNSSRGLSLAYGNDGNLTGTGYNPNAVRFLVGGNVAMQGPLVVIGHVVAGGRFRTARGSTYMIGKDGSAGQAQELTALYQADGGSKYWSLSDRGTHFAVSSFDVPRYIPASRIAADITGFFTNAQKSIGDFFDCITKLQPNGTVTEHYHEWILRGKDPRQNIFLVDVSPNGILNKEIRFEIPQGSRAIVVFRTGNNAHIQYGLWGSKNLANDTLYVFEDAKHIHMEVPAAIWGSILAPQAMFHAHPTGGTVYGNAAFGDLEVPASSGFEFHLFPFAGGILCNTMTQPQASSPVQQPITLPEQVSEQLETPRPEQMFETVQDVIPRQMPEQILNKIPEQTPTICPVCPQPVPCPSCPTPAPCPEAEACPTPAPCPEAEACPTPMPCPEAKPCPVCVECPVQGETRPCPPCPSCPEAPAPMLGPVRIQPIPIPIPIPCPEQVKCEKCLVTTGCIYGCIWGCCCNNKHEWQVKLYKNCSEKQELLYCITINNCACFQFDVPYDDYYILEVCPVNVIASSHRHSRHKEICKPMITLKNVGVANLMIK